MSIIHDRSVCDTLLELSPARATLYEFLSTALMEPPTPKMMQILADLTSAIDRADAETDEVLTGLTTLSGLAKNLMVSDTQLRKLRQEFMDLFHVPCGKYTTPYESVYRDTREVEGQHVKGLLLGASAVDAQKWYRLAAAEMESRTKELPDHIGVELAFVAYLCRQESEFAAMENHDHLEKAWYIEREFIREHIISWVAQLASNVQSKAESSFYSAILDLVLALARQDLTLLDSHPGLPASARIVR